MRVHFGPGCVSRIPSATRRRPTTRTCREFNASRSVRTAFFSVHRSHVNRGAAACCVSACAGSGAGRVGSRRRAQLPAERAGSLLVLVRCSVFVSPPKWFGLTWLLVPRLQESVQGELKQQAQQLQRAEDECATLSKRLVRLPIGVASSIPSLYQRS